MRTIPNAAQRDAEYRRSSSYIYRQTPQFRQEQIELSKWADDIRAGRPACM